MAYKVYVGNLPWSVTGGELEQLFVDAGFSVDSANVVADHDTGRSRGFGFVELRTPAAVVEAVRDLDGCVLRGRPLRVSEAAERPRGERPRGGGGSRPVGGRGGGGVRRPLTWGDDGGDE